MTEGSVASDPPLAAGAGAPGAVGPSTGPGPGADLVVVVRQPPPPPIDPFLAEFRRKISSVSWLPYDLKQQTHG